jgi:hypothetical protein
MIKPEYCTRDGPKYLRAPVQFILMTQPSIWTHYNAITVVAFICTHPPVTPSTTWFKMDKINTTGEKSMHTMSTLSAEPFERDWVVDEVLNN